MRLYRNVIPTGRDRSVAVQRRTDSGNAARSEEKSCESTPIFPHIQLRVVVTLLSQIRPIQTFRLLQFACVAHFPSA